MLLAGIGLVIELAIVIAAIVAIGLSFFVKRHRETSVAQPGWERTDEVFRDPSTQRLMRVWVDPKTNERNYVPE